MCSRGSTSWGLLFLSARRPEPRVTGGEGSRATCRPRACLGEELSVGSLGSLPMIASRDALPLPSGEVNASEGGTEEGAALMYCSCVLLPRGLPAMPPTPTVFLVRVKEDRVPLCWLLLLLLVPKPPCALPDAAAANAKGEVGRPMEVPAAAAAAAAAASAASASCSCARLACLAAPSALASANTRVLGPKLPPPPATALPEKGVGVEGRQKAAAEEVLPCAWLLPCFWPLTRSLPALLLPPGPGPVALPAPVQGAEPFPRVAPWFLEPRVPWLLLAHNRAAAALPPPATRSPADSLKGPGPPAEYRDARFEADAACIIPAGAGEGDRGVRAAGVAA